MAVTSNVIVLIVVQLCMFVKVYYHKTSPAKILIRYRVVNSVNNNKDTYKIFCQSTEKT